MSEKKVEGEDPPPVTMSGGLPLDEEPPCKISSIIDMALRNIEVNITGWPPL